MNSNINVERTDQGSFKPALMSVLTVAALTIISQLPGQLSFFLIPISFLGYVIGLIVILGTTIFLLIKKRPRRAASIFMVFLLPLLLWTPIKRVSELIHLGLTAGFGVGQLGTQSSNRSDFKAYDWSVGLAGGPNTFLIHDLTDEIALPVAQHTHPPTSDSDFEELCAGNTRHLVSHYYVCTI